MNRVRTIYEEIYGKSLMANCKDGQLSGQIQEKINEVMDGDKLTKEEIGDLVFAGSSIGQAQGFQEGFQYAFALIFESLIG